LVCDQELVGSPAVVCVLVEVDHRIRAARHGGACQTQERPARGVAMHQRKDIRSDPAFPGAGRFLNQEKASAARRFSSA
jgi:hypothetical protein